MVNCSGRVVIIMRWKTFFFFLLLPFQSSRHQSASVLWENTYFCSKKFPSNFFLSRKRTLILHRVGINSKRRNMHHSTVQLFYWKCINYFFFLSTCSYPLLGTYLCIVPSIIIFLSLLNFFPFCIHVFSFFFVTLHCYWFVLWSLFV